jgi:hypothetical protein
LEKARLYDMSTDTSNLIINRLKNKYLAVFACDPGWIYDGKGKCGKLMNFKLKGVPSEAFSYTYFFQYRVSCFSGGVRMEAQ